MERYVRAAHAYPRTCATGVTGATVGFAIATVVGAMLAFTSPQAREWVILRDDVTSWADAGELASAMLDGCVVMGASARGDGIEARIVSANGWTDGQ